MERHSLDYDQLSESLEKKAQKVYRLKDVEDRIEKVAFDMVRFRDSSDTDQLWKVTESEEGPVIVALYDDEGQLNSDGNSSVKEASDWKAVVDNDNIHIFYKSDPIAKIAARDLNVPVEELSTAARWLPSKLASDHGTQAFVLSFAGKKGMSHLIKTYPELKKAAFASESLPVKTKDPVSKVAVAALKIRQSGYED